MRQQAKELRVLRERTCFHRATSWEQLPEPLRRLQGSLYTSRAHTSRCAKEEDVVLGGQEEEEDVELGPGLSCFRGVLVHGCCMDAVEAKLSRA